SAHEETTNFGGSHLSIDLERGKSLFDKSQENSEDVAYFTNAITELLLQVEIQNREIKGLRETISKYCKEILYLKELYQKKCEENDKLIQHWDSRHNNQHKCIEEVINITQHKRE
ncbi:15095_t:CDS:1, partial [Dentiscutata heterogama]